MPAELDQLAASLALEDPAAGRHLPRAYELWLSHFVDHQHGGTWPIAVTPGEPSLALKAEQKEAKQKAKAARKQKKSEKKAAQSAANGSS